MVQRKRWRWIPVMLFVLWGLACNDEAKDAEKDSDNDPDDSESVEPPDAICDAPPLVDVSSPDQVVGDGTAESCTADALRTAVTSGGVIVFDCGPAPITIEIASQIATTEETVIDGGGLVTLSGGNRSRILYLDSGYDQTEPRLTVQRLTFKDGKTEATGEDTADGGAAIYRDGGSLTVLDCAFSNNHGPSTGQDLAGGAIYAFGGGETVISGSTFIDNSASDGGAVGSLNGDLTIVNSTFSNNAAKGTEGNPGNGGCGGAIYQDGADERTSLCGVKISNNTAGQIGGGVFRVSNAHNGTFAMDRTSVDSNTITAAETGNAGGLYLEGLAVSVTNSTVSRNQAYYNGGMWIHTSSVAAVNVTVAENVATGSNGGGLWFSSPVTGTFLNCTIANNRAPADGMGGGAVFNAGEITGLEFKNMLIANNTSATWAPGCSDPLEDGDGNLEWPDGANCTRSPTVEDPLLGPLTDNGGETQTLLPSNESPAVRLGTDCPTIDQRGRPRGNPCTAGAVEVSAK